MTEPANHKVIAVIPTPADMDDVTRTMNALAEAFPGLLVCGNTHAGDDWMEVRPEGFRLCLPKT